MRNLKRFLAMALTILMVAGCFSAFSANAFDDVYDFEEAIDTLNELGVIRGYDDTTYGPDDDVLRWHMALLVAKLSTGIVTTSTWESATNSTKFADVRPEHYYGSIAWASGTGVIIGTSETTFEPEGQITYQDALTMVVRALGFGGEAMDAGYPWKYIQKANELGLGSGLEYIDDYETYLTRGETAQLLYNALYAENADGETFAQSAFGLATPETMLVVLTATNRLNMLNNKTVVKNEYVGFNPLKEDGTLNENLTYYVNKAEFGIGEDEDEDNYVGRVYKVYSQDDYATLIKADAIVGNSDVELVGFAEKKTGLISVDGEVYQVVENYTRLNNTGEYIGNYPELILFAKDGSYTKAASNVTYVTDSRGNLLGADGRVVVYYMPQLVGFYNPYVVISASGAVRAAMPSDFAQVAVIPGETVNCFEKILNTQSDFAAVSAVYDATVYDVDGDGTYDRGYFVNYSFGAYGLDAKGNLVIGSVNTGRKPADIKYIDAEGNAIDPIDGGYYLYSYNAQGGILTIKEELPVYSGYLSGINTIADKLTIGGTVYSYGIPCLPAAEPADVERDVSATLIGKYINYVMYNDTIVDIVPVQSAGYIVFDSVIGVTSSGLPTALVYNGSNMASVIVVATLDSYSYYHFNFNNDVLYSVTRQLQATDKGTLFAAEVDALGYYHLVNAESAMTLNADAAQVIDFKNGISNADAITGQFGTTADTVFLLYNNGTFISAKGIPADGATLNINLGGEYLVVKNGFNASFVYVRGGSFAGLTTRPAWTNPENTTIVYFDKQSAVATVVENGLSSVIGVEGLTLMGYTYKFDGVLDVINGKAIDVYSASYNARVEPGKFYTVVNGYIDREIDITAPDSPIKRGYLGQVSATSATYVENGTNALTSYDRASTTLVFIGSDGRYTRVADVNPANPSLAPYNYAADTTAQAKINVADQYLPVLYYVGDEIRPTSKTFIAVDGNTALADEFGLDGWDTIDEDDITINVPDPELININFNGGSESTGSAPEMAPVAPGTVITVPDCTYSKPGYEFAGWLIGDTVYQPGEPYTVNGPVDAVAQWTPEVPTPAETFTVTYTAGGGTGTAPTQADVEEGTVITLKANTFTKAGYVFDGWSIGGTKYAAGASYTVVGNTTITATWKAEEPTPAATYSVTYAGGTGATGTAPTQADVEEGTVITLKTNTFTKTGYTFKGWSADGIKVYDEGDTYTVTADVTFTAQWEEDAPAPVSEAIYVFDGSETGNWWGSAATTQDSTLGKPALRSESTTTEPTWIVMCGNLKDAGNGSKDISAYKTITLDLYVEDASVVSQFQMEFSDVKDNPEPKHCLVFTGTASDLGLTDGWNHLEFSVADAEKQELFDATKATYVRTMIVQNGTTEFGIANIYGSTEELAPPTPAETFSVTYAGGTGATGTAPTQADVEDGTVITLKANTFTKTGYTFKGWSADGIKVYDEGDTYTVTADVTFTAQWDVEEESANSMRIFIEDSNETFLGNDTVNVSLQFKGENISGVQSIIMTFDPTKVAPVMSAWGTEEMGPDACSFKENLDYYIGLGEERVDYHGQFGSYKGDDKFFTIFPAEVKVNRDVVDKWTSNGVSADLLYAEKDGMAYLYIIIKQDKIVSYTDYTTGLTLRFAVYDGEVTEDSIKVATTAQSQALYASCSASLATVADGAQTIQTYVDNGNPSTLSKPETVVDGSTPPTPPTPETYSVTYVGGTGATGTAPTQADVEEDTDITLAANTFTKEGYTFIGWSDGTTTYEAGSTYTVTADVTFTAQWEEVLPVDRSWIVFDPATLSSDLQFVYYNFNGADVGVSSADCTTVEGQPAIVKPVTTGRSSAHVTMSGLKLGLEVVEGVDWYKLLDGCDPTTDKCSLNVNFYVSDASKLDSGVTVKVYNDRLHEDCYYTWDVTDVVDGWNTFTLPMDAAHLTGTIERVSDALPLANLYVSTYTNNTDEVNIGLGLVTVDKMGEADTDTVCSVTYAAGEGATGTAPTQADVEEDTDITLAANTFTKEGYTFIGWSDGTTTYEAGSTYTVTADVTFTAQWEEDVPTPPAATYSVTYVGGTGATGTAPTQADVEEDTDITLAANTFTKEGYSFIGWSDGTTTYEAGSTYTVTADVTFTAQWEEDVPTPPAVTYTVSYERGGSTGLAPVTKTGPWGAGTAGIKDGESMYTDATCPVYCAIASTTAASIAGVKVRLYVSDASKIDTNIDIAFELNNAAGAVVAWHLTDYEFVNGWNDVELSVDDAQTYSGDPINTLNSLRFFSYATGSLGVSVGTVQIVTAEVTGKAPADQTAEEGTSVNLAANTFAKEGYVFAGWTDGTNTYDAGASYTVNADVTMTPVFELYVGEVFFVNYVGGATTEFAVEQTGNWGAEDAGTVGDAVTYSTTKSGSTDKAAIYCATVSTTAPAANGIQVELYVSDVTKLATDIAVSFELNNEDSSKQYVWGLNSYPFVSGWNTVTLSFAEAGVKTLTNLSELDGIRFFAYVKTGTLAVSVGEIKLINSDVTGTAPASAFVNDGDAVTLPVCPFVKDGYGFKGWSDGTNVYQTGASYTVTAPTTFTATWEALSSSDDEIGITFVGGTGATGTAPVINLKTVLCDGNLTNANGTWNYATMASDADGAYLTLGPGETPVITFSAASPLNISSYASGKFHADVFVDNASKATYGQFEICSNNTCDDYELNINMASAGLANGWNSLDIAVADLVAEGTHAMNKAAYTNSRLYMGSNIRIGLRDVYFYNDTVTLPANTFTKTGYEFKGWSDGTNTYQPGDTYTVTGNVTMTAQWGTAVPTYSVTYVGGDGATGTAPTQADVDEGTAITLKANTFTKTGCTFKGWSDGTTVFQAGASYTVKANTTFTAQWEIATADNSMRVFVAGNPATFNGMPTRDVELQFKGENISGVQAIILAFDPTKVAPVMNDAGIAALGSDACSFKENLDYYIGQGEDRVDYNGQFGYFKNDDAYFTIFPSEVKDGRNVVDKWTSNGVSADLMYAEKGGMAYLYIIIKQDKVVTYSDYKTGLTLRFAVLDGTVTSDTIRVATTAEANALNASNSASIATVVDNSQIIYIFYDSEEKKADSNLAKPAVVIEV